MPAFLARLLRSLTPTTLSAQLAGMLIGGILLLHGVATVTVQRVEERQDMGQDVMLEGHCRQPWTVRPNSLRRCLSNLLDNALRYSARVRIRLLEKADVLQIDVLDDGPGIPPEMLEQVFEPFFRLDEARSPHTGGSGLGLSIARSMACRNGGELSLHNRPEGGLCARLCLYRSAMETESL